MASLEEAFTNQINTRESARNPNAYLANHQARMRQQEPEWTQQFSHSWQPPTQESQGWSPSVQESQGWSPSVQESQGWSPSVQESQGWSPSVQESQGWSQQPQREWLTPKQSQQQPYQQQPYQQPRQQAVNDAVSPQQAVEQIAHQHRFQPAELKLQPAEPNESHWWFIRARTGVEYCYPKRFNYRAGDD